MRTTIKIAGQEFTTLFFSPVAWLILMVFPIQIGLDFTQYMLMLGRSQRMGASYSEITNVIFASQNGFFPAVKNTLFLYIPLLTMGLISRELHSGTIKLLLSSPVKVKQIVWGKYLAMMAYGLLLVGIIALYSYAASFFIINIDYLQVIAGLAGLYLLICAYAAIGLFMSSLTSYQVVAAISTLAVLGLLSFAGGLFQSNDTVRHITYFISIAGRTEQFISGLLSSEDLIYFLLVIGVFLALTMMRLQAARERKNKTKTAGRYAILMLITIVVAYASSRPATTVYLDMTLNKGRTLSKYSKDLIQKMDQPLKITTYVNILDDIFYLAAPDTKSADERRFNQYRRFLPKLEMNYVYYYGVAKNKQLYKSNLGTTEEEIAKKVADIHSMDFKKLLTPAQISQIVDLEKEENRVVRQLEYGQQKTFLRYYQDMRMFPGEREITAALKRLLEPETIPLVLFINDHNTRSPYKAGDADYRKMTAELNFRFSLINQGFDVDTLNLITGKIPDNTAVIVWADPQQEMHATGLEKLQSFIEKGGNLLLLTEPESVNNMKPVLQYLDVFIADKRIEESSADFPPDFIQAKLAHTAGLFSERLEHLRRDSAMICMQGVSGIGYAAEKFKVLPVVEDNQGNTLLVSLTRTVGDKQQKIIVASDADFMSTAALNRRNPEHQNFSLANAIFTWYGDGAFPVNTSALPTKDYLKTKDDDIQLMRFIFFGLLPACILIVGATVLMYRKRR